MYKESHFVVVYMYWEYSVYIYKRVPAKRALLLWENKHIQSLYY